MLNHKRLLITGGTGSFGKVFTKRVLQQFPEIREIVLFSRDPEKQEYMQKEFSGAPIRFFSGDISDKESVYNACRSIDLIVHTAAIRLVGEAENDPWAAISANVLGAKNLIDAALDNGCKQIIALSTDMASLVNHTYGATKMLSDKLFIDSFRRYPELKTCIVRFGNMFGSAGTVIPFFIKQAEEGKDFPVTDPRMTRFMSTLEECSDIVLEAIKNNIGGEIIAPKIKSYNILTVTEAINKDAPVRIIGLRPGEKLFEEMVTKYESFYTIETPKAYIIVPPFAGKDSYISRYQATTVHSGFEFNSENNPDKFTVSGMRALIESLYTLPHGQ